MKKRFMAALLCLCLLMGTFAATAYAEAGSVIADNIESTTSDGYAVFDEEADTAYSTGIDITAQAFDNAIANADHVYRVEIVWGDMAFAWGATDKITKTWQPEDHSYEDDAAKRTEKWYLINDGKTLPLEYDAAGEYSSVAEGTNQNYVLMFNHSDQPVNANVKITEIYNGVEDSGNADNITATIKPDASFGTTATANETDGGYDYALGYDTETGVLYSKENGTAGAAYVELANKPADGALNKESSTTVAKVTITLSIPGSDEPDVDEGGSED